MKYIRLPYLANTYPQTGNYISVNDNPILYGKYSDVNQINFQIPSISSIKVVDGTKFRNIVALYKDVNDESPIYYTSELYSRDLEASKIESNPYLIKASFNSSSILKIYLKEIIQSINSLRDAEVKLGVQFIRNNFILFDESGIESTIEDTTPPTSANAEQISILNDRIKRMEDDLINVDTQFKDIPFFSLKRQRNQITVGDETFQSNPSLYFTETNKTSIKLQASNRIAQLKSERDSLITTDYSIEENSSQSNTPKKKFRLPNVGSILNPVKIDNNVKKVLDKVIGANDETDIIEIDGVYIDCVHLIKYIDWMLSKPTFQEIETGNVIPAEKLSVFKTNEKVQTDETQNQNQQGNTTQTEVKYFSYDIYRLSIPATAEQSIMQYIDKFGNTQTIQTSNYGFVANICAAENSWTGAYQLFQRTQVGVCTTDDYNQNNSNNGGGSGYSGGGGGGRSGIDFIDYNQDREFISRAEAAQQAVQ